MGLLFQLTLATRQVLVVLINGKRKDPQFKTCIKDREVSQLAMAMVHLCIFPSTLEMSNRMAIIVMEVGACLSARLLVGQHPTIKTLLSSDGGVSPAFARAMVPFLASFVLLSLAAPTPTDMRGNFTVVWLYAQAIHSWLGYLYLMTQ